MRALLFITLSILIAACGGGGGGGDSSGSVTAASAEGLWNGATDFDNAISILVLDDGTYWAWLSGPGQTVKDAYLMHGYGTSRNGTFISSELNVSFALFDRGGIETFRTYSNYVDKQSFGGVFTYFLSHLTFATSYDAGYELAPGLSIIAGNYSGVVKASGGNAVNVIDFYHRDVATVTISATGEINGNTDSGCLLSGTVAPRNRGNVYDLELFFTGGTDVCPLGGRVTGVVYYDAPTNTLYVPAVNDTGVEGFLFLGTKL